jgi:hypothetical protein
MCHGISGKGDGHLYVSGLYPVKPRPLTGTGSSILKDGELFHTITLGFGSMGAHGAQIRPEDRWKVISYIHTIRQEEQTGK